MAQLFHSDCYAVFPQLPSDSVDLILTDPPYGIFFKSGRQTVDRRRSVNGEGSIQCRDDYFDKIEEDDGTLDLAWIKSAYKLLKNDSAIYVFTHWKTWGELCKACQLYGFSVKSMIVMNKSNHGMGDLSGFSPKHELLLYATKGKHKLAFPSGRISDVWTVPVKFSGTHRFHPNEKPLSWLTPAIENSSQPGQIILDPFMGSGTTGVAAIGMGRKFIGIEKDLEYFQVAEKRIQNAEEKIGNKLL